MASRRTSWMVLIATTLLSGCGLDLVQELDQFEGPKQPEANANIMAARYVGGEYRGVIGETVNEPVKVYHFTYQNGVTLFAMSRLAALEGNALYWLQVRESLERYREVDLYRPKLGDEPIDYLGSMAHATLAYGLLSGDTTYQHEALDAAEYFFNDHPRTPDGLIAFSHNPGRGRIWADALWMTMPLMAKAGSVTGNTAYYDDVLSNFAGFAAKLQNPDTLLWHQGWNWHGDGASPGYWSRGNGWVAAAMAESLRAIPDDYPGRSQLLLDYQTFMAALAKYQDADGMWRQLIDRPDTYPETSGTGLITYAIAVGVEQGWLDEPFREVVQRGAAGLADQVSLNGSINNVSPGTPVQSSEAAYANRGPARNDSHGIGTAMLGFIGGMLVE